jgi:cytochrome c oxidase subunit 2
MLMNKLSGIYSLILSAIMSSLFGGAAVAQQAQPTIEINIKARRFYFEPSEITVSKGQRVRLKVTSEDVEHGFAIDEFGISESLQVGQSRIIEFTPDREGRFRFYCSVYCGDGHDQMFGYINVTSADSGGIQVQFEEAGVVIVQANGEKFRIDTHARTVTRLGKAEPPAVARAPEPTREPEPYDYRLINLPTPKRVPRGSLNLHFTHRFSEPIRRLPGERVGDHRSRIARGLFGLDSFSVSSFGITYGITDKLYAIAYRSPLCQRGICKTIELGLGYHLLDQLGRSPIALSVQATVEGEDNFSERYVQNIQVMISHKPTKRIYLFFAPAVHFNTNGSGQFNPRPEEFFPREPMAEKVNLGSHTASFGFGTSVRVLPSVSLLFEFTPRVGFKLGQVVPIFDERFTKIMGFENRSHPEIGFGIEKRIGRHVFALTFSNTQTTTTSRYNSSNMVLSPSNWTIGFNLFRRLR